MGIVSFNLEKISVEKKTPIKGNVDVKNNVTIKNVEEQVLALGDAKKDGLKFTFEFAALYTPDVGSISITGSLMYVANNKRMKDVLKMWEKERKLTKEVAPEIINTILMRCSVKTLSLAQEVNLPPNISLPALRVNPEQDVKNYIG